MKAYHFTNGMKLRDGQELIVGKTYKHTGSLEMCSSGLHASIEPFDALQYAPGSTLSLVECGGEMIKGDDKIVCTERTALQTITVDKELSLFACWCVRQIWHLLKDDRSKKAVIVAEKFARGKATEEELTAVRVAAGAVEWAAASNAAWAAASNAEWAAASAAARVAALDASRAAQRKYFNRMIKKLFKESK